MNKTSCTKNLLPSRTECFVGGVTQQRNGFTVTINLTCDKQI